MSGNVRILDTAVSGLTCTFTIALAAGQIKDILNARLESLRPKARVKGFRPGKAPLNILRGHFGARLTQEVVDQLSVRVAGKIIRDRRLRPVSRPVVDSFMKREDGEFQFRLTIELFPQVTLVPLTGLRVQRLTATPDDKRIENVRLMLHDSNAALARERVARELGELSRLHIKRQVLDWLAAHYDFEVPRTMVETEFRRILDDHRKQVGGHIDFEVEQRYRAIAERRIRLAIILLELGKAHNVRVPATEVQRLVRRETKRDEKHDATIIDFYLDHPSALAELQSPLLEESIVGFILSQSEIADRTVSADELVDAAGMEVFGIE